MDELTDQQKRRFFHAKPAMVAITYCYDFVMYPNGLMKHFKNHRVGPNEKILLYFLTRHMSTANAEGESTDFKDVAQSFWFTHDYIMRKTGMIKPRLSEALHRLIDCGILIKETIPGIGQWIAFSVKAVQLWREYAAEMIELAQESGYGERNRRITATVTDALRSPSLTRYGERNGPFIEEKGIGFRDLDGGGGRVGANDPPPPPQKIGKPHIGWVRAIDWVFVKDRKGSYDILSANAWGERVFQKYGEDWCWRAYEVLDALSQQCREAQPGYWKTHRPALELFLKFLEKHMGGERYEPLDDFPQCEDR